VTPQARRQLARLAAPAAFLLAATIFVLIVRSGMEDDEPAEPVAATATRAPATNRARPATTRRATTAAATTQASESHTVQRGDTYETIAEQYGTTVDALLDLNPGVDPTQLTIGQEIRVR
jgi:LysM repeat protein